MQAQKYALLLFFLLISTTILLAQTTKTVGNRTDAPTSDYETLKAAIDAINDGAISGEIILQIVANTTETGSVSLSGSGTGSSSYSSVLIYPTVSATISISTGDLLILSGADNVTIDGRIGGPSPISNTRGLTMQSTYANTDRNDAIVVLINGATYNTVKYCNIKGALAANPNTGGVINFKTSTDLTGNNNNTISNNLITSYQSVNRARVGIMCNGTSGKANNNNTISNNEFADLWSETLQSTSLSIKTNANNWTISGNSFYQTAALAVSGVNGGTFPLYNILIQTGVGHLVENNYLGGTAALASGTLTATSTGVGMNFQPIIIQTASASIQGNIIRGFDIQESANQTCLFWGISCISATVDIGTVKVNVIGGDLEAEKIKVKYTGTNQLDLTGIYIWGSSAVTSTYNIKNNIIKGIVSDNFTATNRSNISGITLGNGSLAMNSATVVNISNNTIQNLSALSSSTGSEQYVIGIFNRSLANVTMDGNTIHNQSNSSTNSLSSTSGIRHSPSAEGICTIKNNFIYDTEVNSRIYYGILMTQTGFTLSNNIIALTGNIATGVWGIYDNSANFVGNTSILNNTVYIGGTISSGAKFSWALQSSSSQLTRKISGNLLINARSNSGTASGKHYAIRFINDKVPNVINFNNYYISGTGGFLGSINGVDKTTLADWQLATSQDCNSYNVDPGFASAGGTSSANYLPSNVVLKSNEAEGVLTDFSGVVRSTHKSAMGALEYAITPGSSSLYISSFTPTSSSASTEVTITGIGFTGATSVKFNGIAATSFTVNSATEIVATVPSLATTGKISITVPCGLISNTILSNTDFTIAEACLTKITYYKDLDGDGYGDPAQTIESCSQPAGYVANNTDCNDADATKWQSASLYIDTDGDGYDNGSSTVCYGASVPTGYKLTTSGTDCDDADATKYTSFSFYADTDGDGYGAGSLVSVCAVDANTPPSGYVSNNTDCAPNDATKWQSASLYIDTDGDGYDNGSSTVCYGASVPTGYKLTTSGTDCDDADATKYTSFSFYADTDGDGYGAGSLVSVCAVDANTPPSGYVSNNTDCAPNDATKWQSASLYIDTDGDGYDNGSSTVCYGASVPTGYKLTTSGTDCDDADATKYTSFSFYADTDGDGYGAGSLVSVCAVDANTPPSGYVSNNTDCAPNDATKWQSASLYIDTDGDGYDNGSSTVCYGASVPTGYKLTTSGTDCDDADATKYTSFSFYADTDGDGYGAGSLVSVCAVDANTPPSGYVSNNTDCAPNDATKWQSASLYIDTDGDGYDNGSSTVCYGASVPTGYKLTTSGTDCDDADATKYTSFSFYADTDGDGYGAGSLVSVCAVDANTPPSGYVSNNTDCAPNDATKWQSASLYIDTDGDGYDNGSSTVCYGASVPTGYKLTTSGTDCDDADATKYTSFSFYADTDGDGYGAGSLVSVCAVDANTPPSGYVSNNTDCAPNDATKWQSASLYIDTDGDGYTNGSRLVCYGSSIPTGFKLSANGIDCNDNNANVNPGKTEICGNKIDDNCNGQVDEGCLVACNFKTYSQSIWASGCYNRLTSTWFKSKFPKGIIIGGITDVKRKITLITSAAVMSFIPNIGTPAALSKTAMLNPTNKTVKNTFAGQLVALILNIANNPGLEQAIITTGIYKDKTVNWLLTESQKQISNGLASAITLKNLSDACEKVNVCFESKHTGYLMCLGTPAIITSSYINTQLINEIVSDNFISIKAYPNPTYSTFELINQSSSPVDLRIVNVNGQVIQTFKQLIPGSRTTIGSNYKQGIYFCDAVGLSGRQVLKLVKQ